MQSQNTVIEVSGLSKRYRLGVSDEANEHFIGSILHQLRHPIENFRRYRSLYDFRGEQDDLVDSESILWALKDVTFNVQEGDAMGIIGSNGAGKTTLLKILSRIVEPTLGEARIKGRVSSLLEVGTGFHGELTGRENIFLNGSILGMRKREIDAKYDEIVAFSGVEKFLSTPVKRYSTGMKTRLAFAIAAHLEPEVLIVDEVLAVGDAEFQKKCLDKMDDTSKSGRTVLFVSHNMAAINRLCNRAILLEHGSVAFEGKTHDVVSGYFEKTLNVGSERVWEGDDAPGKSIARLRSIGMLDQCHRAQSSFDIRRPIYLRMQYEVLESGHVLMPHFHLYNEEGVCVWVSFDLEPKWRGVPRPTGFYEALVEIPGNLLAEGTFFVEPWITVVKSIRFGVEVVVHNALKFHVVDTMEGDSARGDFGESLPGVVRPMLKWQTARKD